MMIADIHHHTCSYIRSNSPYTKHILVFNIEVIFLQVSYDVSYKFPFPFSFPLLSFSKLNSELGVFFPLETLLMVLVQGNQV